MQNNIKFESSLDKYEINYGVLRILAVFLAIISTLSWDIINLPAQNAETFMNLKQILIFAFLGHSGIPLLVMLSGAFFTDPEKNISANSIFKKYIPKLIGFFLIWSFFYALIEQKFFSGVKAVGPIEAWSLLDGERLLKNTLLGPQHLWYIYALLALYLITPFLQIIIKNVKKAQLNYLTFLCVSLPLIVEVNNGIFHNETVNLIIAKSGILFPSGFLGYYLLGYMLRKLENKKIFGIIFTFAAVAILYYSALRTMEMNPIGGRAPVNLSLLGYFSPAIYMISIALFVVTGVFKRSSSSGYKNEVLKEFARYAGGVYMAHPFVIKMCEMAKIILPVPKWQGLLVNTAIVFFLSFILIIIIGMPFRAITKSKLK